MVGRLNVVDQVGAGSASLLRRVSRLAVLTDLAVLVVSDPAAVGVEAAGKSVSIFESALAVDPAGAIMPIGVPLMAGPGTISLVVADAPAALTRRMLVSPLSCTRAMGPYLFQQLMPRLRSWLGQSQELMLQRLIGLLITALAMLILVNGLRVTYPILA